MRKILFRGKTENGSWLYGDLLNCRQWKKDLKDSTFITLVLAKPPESIGDNETIIKTEVIPETVGQYTGLTDKNGNKIFEGDVVKIHLLGGIEIGQIIYNEMSFRFKFADKYGSTYGFDDTCTFEVIGNIHDNPELLKENDNA